MGAARHPVLGTTPPAPGLNSTRTRRTPRNRREAATAAAEEITMSLERKDAAPPPEPQPPAPTEPVPAPPEQERAKRSEAKRKNGDERWPRDGPGGQVIQRCFFVGVE